MGDKYIAWLSDLSKSDLNLAGGKGANLGEMYNSHFPVPQAFVVTTDAFSKFLKETKIKDQIKDLLKRIDVDDTDNLTEKSKEIRELINSAKMPEDLSSKITEAYDHFNIDLKSLEGSPGALAILKSSREPIFVSVRSSATAEDLDDSSFAGQQESFLNIKGNRELIEAIKKVFASIFTARSIYYRKKKGFEAFVGIAAIVQKMINADKAGVIFSKHPVKNTDEILIESVFGLGEGIVSGKIKPDGHVLSRDLEIKEEKIADKKLAIIRTAGGLTKTIQLTPEKSNQRVLKTYELKQLGEYALKLEKHYNKAQDIEFAIENDEIFILQTRPITTLKKTKEISDSEDLDGQILTEGLAASPGVASGTVKIIKSTEDLGKIKKGDILVTTMTNPDMVVTMERAAGIVTSEGGITAHAAIVSREMGIPAVVGTGNALEVMKDGDKVTVDGFNGIVFAGIAENKSVEILPIVNTKIKIKVLVDLPKFSSRAAKTKADGVGLVRLEGLIASSEKHPLFHEENNTLDEYQNMLEEGLGKIAETFIGKKIWIRSSDIRSDEYSNLAGAPKEIEKNPMLGNHGIRFSLKHLGILKAELRAIKNLANKGHKLGVMFPQIISVEEVKAAKEVFKELEMDNVEFGVMIETPAAVIMIKDICEVGIDFISFGTNDLTQYTLAIDRGNEDVQFIYDETNWAVLKQISRVIRECKKQGVTTSICGQAGSNKEMVKFLVKQGIDSISVNADVAKEISVLVQKLENGESVDEVEENKIEEEVEEPQEENEQAKHSEDAQSIEGQGKIDEIDDENSIDTELKERQSDELVRAEEIEKNGPVVEDLLEEEESTEEEEEEESTEEENVPEENEEAAQVIEENTTAQEIVEDKPVENHEPTSDVEVVENIDTDNHNPEEEQKTEPKKEDIFD
ncbi:MAG: phosphoenolpyruvate synthase [Nanoarchaeota archaeon]|nr:phosphoenolpyruvate synthase [Nanoarchaeota archaeon]